MTIASLVPCWKLDDWSFICGKSNESCWEMPIIHSLTVMLIWADNYRCHPMWWQERLWRHVHYQNSHLVPRVRDFCQNLLITQFTWSHENRQVWVIIKRLSEGTQCGVQYMINTLIAFNDWKTRGVWGDTVWSPIHDQYLNSWTGYLRWSAALWYS